jgi:hypothetical protein
MPPKTNASSKGGATTTATTTTAELRERSPSPVVNPDVSSDIPPILFDSSAELELVLDRLARCIQGHLKDVLELEDGDVHELIRGEVTKVEE